jgi:hypothetical protein
MKTLQPEDIANYSFEELMAMAGVELTGILPCGKEWRIVPSAKKAPGLFWGIHAIVEFADGTTAKDAAAGAVGQITEEALKIQS